MVCADNFSFFLSVNGWFKSEKKSEKSQKTSRKSLEKIEKRLKQDCAMLYERTKLDVIYCACTRYLF